MKATVVSEYIFSQRVSMDILEGNFLYTEYKTVQMGLEDTYVNVLGNSGEKGR